MNLRVETNNRYRAYFYCGSVILFRLYLFVCLVQTGEIEGTWYDYINLFVFVLFMASMAWAYALPEIRENREKRIHNEEARKRRLKQVELGRVHFLDDESPIE